ncbi:MAG: STAS domain-containing protein [Planctomycetaceae bacterium]|jgi:anti-anti-sigma factor
MQITHRDVDDRVVLDLEGRIDANWADYLSRALESVVESGRHRVDLDLARVSYISSAGVAVLVRWYQQLRKAGGQLRVVQPSKLVAEVLQLSGLANHLLAALTPPAPTPPADTPVATPPSGQASTRLGVALESHASSSTPVPLSVQLLGDPTRLQSAGFGETPAVPLVCEPELTAIGLMAFGDSGAAARGHYGEGLAVGGAAMIQPADGSDIPDFQVRQQDFLPRTQMLYGLAVRGSFARRTRFEAGGAPRGVVGVGELVDILLDESGWAGMVFALVAESACVIGASLRKSPDSGWEGPPWEFPRVRDWLSFTTERTSEKGMLLVVGVVHRQPSASLARFLRPVSGGSATGLHCHAALFPYRPVPQTELVLSQFLQSLFQTDSARGVLHLVHDERPVEGLGQTDLLRGTVWLSPLEHVSAPGGLPGKADRA